jgi:uncharacterized membrane protein
MHASTRVVLGEAGILVALGGAAALGWSPLQSLPRSWLLPLHVFGAVILLGNVLVGALLLGITDARGSAPVNAFVSRFIGWADAVFTAPGCILLLATGLPLSAPWGGWRAAPWTRWGTLSFVAAGALWLLVLVPLQQRMMTVTEPADGTPSAWQRLARLYTVPGLASVALLLAALAWMVSKAG